MVVFAVVVRVVVANSTNEIVRKSTKRTAWLERSFSIAQDSSSTQDPSSIKTHLLGIYLPTFKQE